MSPGLWLRSSCVESTILTQLDLLGPLTTVSHLVDIHRHAFSFSYMTLASQKFPFLSGSSFIFPFCSCPLPSCFMNNGFWLLWNTVCNHPSATLYCPPSISCQTNTWSFEGILTVLFFTPYGSSLVLFLCLFLKLIWDVPKIGFFLVLLQGCFLSLEFAHPCRETFSATISVQCLCSFWYFCFVLEYVTVFY